MSRSTTRRTRRRTLATAIGAAVLALGALAGCGSDDSISISAGPTASAAPAAGAHLGAEAFAAALKRPDTVILDVRTPAEFAEGHLPGALNIDLQGLDFAARIGELDRAVPYAVYCRSGNRSAVALDQMATLGFTQAYDLTGGIGAWADAGGEVVTD